MRCYASASATEEILEWYKIRKGKGIERVINFLRGNQRVIKRVIHTILVSLIIYLYKMSYQMITLITLLDKIEKKYKKNKKILID